MKTLRITLAALALAFSTFLHAQGIPKAKDLLEARDSVEARLERRTGVRGDLVISKVLSRPPYVDIYFRSGLTDYPWRSAQDAAWLKEQFQQALDTLAPGCLVGVMSQSGLSVADLLTPVPGTSGKAPEFAYRMNDPRLSSGSRFIEEVGAKRFSKGLADRYIALWQSHGRYYHENSDCWLWQRAPLHRTVEDMFTQSYVLDLLMPMLENAGAYVMTPRERDTQTAEYVCDNDPCWKGSREGGVRRAGKYSETGSWTDAGEGFADSKEVWSITDSPFSSGTARQAACSSKPTCKAVWKPEIEAPGRYAVYVSYKSLPQSCTKARYTVRHRAGVTEFNVNQKRGGGTWIYLGIFDLDSSSRVELDNRGSSGEVVTADAVRFGGGMGKVERGGSLSGLPAYMEGALYSEVWSGIDTTVTRGWSTDYVCDYASRGAWTTKLKEEKLIPFDLSLAFHTDAGATPDTSTVGTLVIYTLKSEGRRTYKGGGDRLAARTLCDFVQSQVVGDVRADFNSGWRRRAVWDKNYSETRTTGVPAMILELLSHQNFEDMKYGLDPAFRFTVCRAVYKGILKYISAMYGCSYAVQPLPPRAFAVSFGSDGRAHLSWEPSSDPHEPTAAPKGYKVFTRIDDGAFDAGRFVDGTTLDLPLEPGRLYSFKVVAWNDGGYGFPSEILSIGKVGQYASHSRTVQLVNNFTRVSGPTWFDTPSYAGFLGSVDSGVPYVRDISYIGENYELRRSMQWDSDSNPGFGASHTDSAGLIVAGNTFDYPAVHGRSLMALGYSFCSSSVEAFCADSTCCAGVLDLICGKQVTVCGGPGAGDRFSVFPSGLQQALRRWTSAGGDVIISGADIATDVWDSVYPTGKKPSGADQAFVRSVLGYKFDSSNGTGSGKVGGMPFFNEPCGECYCVECPDGLAPTEAGGKAWMRYPGGIPAGVLFTGGGYKVASLGVPIECLKDEADRCKVFSEALQFFEND